MIHEHKYTSNTEYTSETVNPTSYTRRHMHSQVKHFQPIRKVRLIKFDPNRQNTSTRTSQRFSDLNT